MQSTAHVQRAMHTQMTVHVETTLASSFRYLNSHGGVHQDNSQKPECQLCAKRSRQQHIGL
jgi:hypothetical protein